MLTDSGSSFCHDANKSLLFDGILPYLPALIDIDGNSWSSRFIRLLCTNSVVIKVRVMQAFITR